MLATAVAVVFCAAVCAQVQNAPVTEPRGRSVEPPVVKGAAAISQQRDKCITALIVEADALFKPHRWTLNPDAAETLDVLGPMIVKAGGHPASLLAETAVSDSDNENRDVAHRRAVTVRTWLINHHFVPGDISITESGNGKPVGPAGGVRSPANSERPRSNGRVSVIVTTCH